MAAEKESLLGASEFCVEEGESGNTLWFVFCCSCLFSWSCFWRPRIQRYVSGISEKIRAYEAVVAKMRKMDETSHQSSLKTGVKSHQSILTAACTRFAQCGGQVASTRCRGSHRTGRGVEIYALGRGGSVQIFEVTRWMAGMAECGRIDSKMNNKCN